MAEKQAENACEALEPTAIGGVVGAAEGEAQDDVCAKTSSIFRGAIADEVGGATVDFIAGLSVMPMV